MYHKHKEQYKPLDFHQIEEEKFMDICCPKCDNGTPVKNLNLDKAVGKCDNCDVLFSIEESIVQLQSNSSESKYEIKRPAGIDILELENELELTLSQSYSIPYLIYASFGYLPAIGLIVAYFNKGNFNLLMLGILFSMAFIYSFYKLLSFKKDKIYISIDQQNIHILYRPKNFKSDKVYSRSDIDQLYVKTNTDGLALYMIVNSPDGQKHEKILGRFTSIGKAKYIEQEIEKYLGLENKKVAGEVG